MGTAVVSENRRLHNVGNGHGENGGGHDGQHERVRSSRRVQDDEELSQVLQEIMRLVDASKEGRLSERGKATLFNGMHRELVQA